MFKFWLLVFLHYVKNVGKIVQGEGILIWFLIDMVVGFFSLRKTLVTSSHTVRRDTATFSFLAPF